VVTRGLDERNVGEGAPLTSLQMWWMKLWVALAGAFGAHVPHARFSSSARTSIHHMKAAPAPPTRRQLSSRGAELFSHLLTCSIDSEGIHALHNFPPAMAAVSGRTYA
jgi:hypothetical protein